MKNKLILLILTFLITTPLAAMEEGAEPFRGDERSPASPEAQSSADQITIELMDGEVKLDKVRFLPILQQSQTISDLLEDIPTEKIEFLLPNITKGNFEVAISLIEFLKEGNNAAIDLALEDLNVKKLSNLWNIFNFLDVPTLQKKTQAQLDNTLASYIDKNPSSIPDLLAQLPKSFKQDKFSILFSSNLLPKNLVNLSFNELATLQHHFSVLSVAFDPIHNLLATGSDTTAKIYNSSNLNNNSSPIATLQYDGSGPSIAFDPTNSLLATGLFDEKMVKVYSSSDLTDNSQPIATLKRNPSIRSVAFDPTNSLLATGLFDKKIVKVYSSSDLTDNSQPIATLQHYDWILSLAFDSTHSLLAVGSMDGTGGTSGTVKIYNSSDLTDNSQPIATLKHGGWILSVDFDPTKSLLATGSNDNTAKIYNSSDLNNNSEPIATLKHGGAVNSVAFDPIRSLLATGSSDGAVNIYTISDKNEISLLTTFKDHTKEVSSIAFDPTHSLLATGLSDGTVKIFKISEPILNKLTNEQGLAVLYLLRTKPESITDLPEIIQQIIATIDKETWKVISYLKLEQGKP